jgi:hypothetical protein
VTESPVLPPCETDMTFYSAFMCWLIFDELFVFVLLLRRQSRL